MQESKLIIKTMVDEEGFLCIQREDTNKRRRDYMTKITMYYSSDAITYIAEELNNRVYSRRTPQTIAQHAWAAYDESKSFRMACLILGVIIPGATAGLLALRDPSSNEALNVILISIAIICVCLIYLQMQRDNTHQRRWGAIENAIMRHMNLPEPTGDSIHRRAVRQIESICQNWREDYNVIRNEMNYPPYSSAFWEETNQIIDNILNNIANYKLNKETINNAIILINLVDVNKINQAFDLYKSMLTYFINADKSSPIHIALIESIALVDELLKDKPQKNKYLLNKALNLLSSITNLLPPSPQDIRTLAPQVRELLKNLLTVNAQRASVDSNSFFMTKPYNTFPAFNILNALGEPLLQESKEDEKNLKNRTYNSINDNELPLLAHSTNDL